MSEKSLKEFIEHLKPGAFVDARGTRIGPELLPLLLDAVRDNEDRSIFGLTLFNEAQFTGGACFDGTRFTRASFDKAQFTHGASFDGVQFTRGASFDGARFTGSASFNGAQFAEAASFNGAQFIGRASFGDTKFGGAAWFRASQFTGYTEFDWAQFGKPISGGGAWFMNAKFSKTSFNDAQFGVASFDIAEFAGDTFFHRTRFNRDSSFDWAQFYGGVFFYDSQFIRKASFFSTNFRDEAQFNEARFTGETLTMTGAVFSQAVVLEVEPSELHFASVSANGGATLRVQRADIVLDGTVFARPSSVTSIPLPGKGYERYDRPDPSKEKARLVSLRGLDVANLSLADLDLGPCLFQGAHNLDKLRLEGNITFAKPPSGWYRAGLSLWKWSKRDTLAEEQEWRSRQGRKAEGWAATDGPTAARNELKDKRALDPQRIASLYRDLRKAREDARDEPGAADFYYGEMEMRRKGEVTPWVERRLLDLYWLVSGYALRASRALTALAVTILVFAWLLFEHGFQNPTPLECAELFDRVDPFECEVPFRRALTYSLVMATVVFGGAERDLTPWGEALRVALRIIGPLLLGLAALSLRGRVKR